MFEGARILLLAPFNELEEHYKTLVAAWAWHQVDRVGVVLFEGSIIEIQGLLVGLVTLMLVTIAFKILVVILEMLGAALSYIVFWAINMVGNMIVKAQQGNDWTFAQLMVYVIFLLVAMKCLRLL